jgi:hypothetical protein
MGLKRTGMDSFSSQFQLTPNPLFINNEFEYSAHAAEEYSEGLKRCY